MKKQIISKKGIKILSAAACLAVVGTASAAWQFAKDVTKSDTVKTSIEGYTEVGDITIYDCDKVKLNLDSNLIETNNGDGISWKNDSGEINFGSASDIKADYVEEGDNVDGATTMIRTYTITLDDNLFEYVKFSEGSGDTTQADSVVADSNGKSVKGTWVDNEKIKLPKVVWQNGKCPKTSKQYDEMLKKLGYTKSTTTERGDNTSGVYSAVAGDSAAKVTITFSAAYDSVNSN